MSATTQLKTIKMRKKNKMILEYDFSSNNKGGKVKWYVCVCWPSCSGVNVYDLRGKGPKFESSVAQPLKI